MDSIGFWLSPLLLLPGAALLILSTSIRLNRLHDEVHHQMDQGHTPKKEVIDHLLLRARYFRNALVFLYSSISIFAVAGIIGGLTSGWDEVSTVLTIGLTVIGIIFITAAAIILIKESSLLLKIIESHTKELNEEK
jgi:Protein of unknown function (DUF2721)